MGSEISSIQEGVASQVNSTAKLGEQTGAGVVQSTMDTTNADELQAHLKERVEGAKAENEANRQNASAEKAQATGGQQVQQGQTQQVIGQTTIATGTALIAAGGASFGTMSCIGAGMVVTGTAAVATGTGTQQKGQTTVESGQTMKHKASDLSNKSQQHYAKAETLKNTAEEKRAQAKQNTEGENNTQNPGDKRALGNDLGNGAASSDGNTDDGKSVAQRMATAERRVSTALGLGADSMDPTTNPDGTPVNGTVANNNGEHPLNNGTEVGNDNNTTGSVLLQNSGAAEAAVNQRLGIGRG